jgi:hypothetical protein
MDVEAVSVALHRHHMFQSQRSLSIQSIVFYSGRLDLSWDLCE